MSVCALQPDARVWTPGFAQSRSVWLNVQTAASSLAPVCPDPCPVSIAPKYASFSISCRCSAEEVFLFLFFFFSFFFYFFFFAQELRRQDLGFCLEVLNFSAVPGGEESTLTKLKGPLETNREEERGEKKNHRDCSLSPHPVLQVGLNLVIYEETL